MAMTTDAASNNGRMMFFLSEKCIAKNMWHVSQANSRLNCFAHVLNLAVKDFLSAVTSTNGSQSTRDFDPLEDDEMESANASDAENPDGYLNAIITKKVIIAQISKNVFPLNLISLEIY